MALQNTDVFLVNRGGTSYKVAFSEVSTGVLGDTSGPIDSDTLEGISASQFLRSDTFDEKTSGNLRFKDSIALTFGNSDDFQFFHNGSLNVIDGQFHDIALMHGAEYHILCQDGGAVTLYYNNSSKLATNNAGITVTGDVNSTSDINLKKDIEVITSAVEMISQLRGVKFTWKENDEKSVGVIAQDVEKVLPELIKGEEGDKSVNYSGLIGLLIEAVKEQQKQIDELKNLL